MHWRRERERMVNLHASLDYNGPIGNTHTSHDYDKKDLKLSSNNNQGSMEMIVSGFQTRSTAS